MLDPRLFLRFLKKEQENCFRSSPVPKIFIV